MFVYPKNKKKKRIRNEKIANFTNSDIAKQKYFYQLKLINRYI